MSTTPDLPGIVVVDAQPTPLTVAAASTAVIVVDMQNDFASVGGMLERAGIDIAIIRDAIEPTRTLIDAARSIGIRIAYLKMGFQPDLSDTSGPDSPNWLIHRRLSAGDHITAPDTSTHSMS